MQRKTLLVASFLCLLSLPATAQEPSAPPATSPPPTMAAPPSFEALSERLLPTVVNVATTSKIETETVEGMPALPDLPPLPPGSPFEDFFRDFYDRMQPPPGTPNAPGQPPAERSVSGLGSGFVIDAAKGYIVTNAHVIKGADEIKVILHDDTSLDATLIGADEKTDIALLQVKTDIKLTAAQWGDSDHSRVGSWVIAIGNPFGLGGTVTAGIVSARQRDINAGPYDDFIQTDASINRGNSGGPMFNLKGEVIGVNTAIFSPTGGSVGIGFAVPSNIARNVIDQLVKYGQTRRGWLGVRIQDVTPDIAESLGLDKPRGALVSSVVPDSPAITADIKAGDIILSFNGHDIPTSRALPRLVAESEVGAKAAVTLWRGGKTIDTAVTLGELEKAEKEGKSGPPKTEKPSAAVTSAQTDIATLGLGVSAIDDALRAQYKIPATTQGVLVTAVTPQGPAADKAIQPGDIILEIDQQTVNTPAELADKVDSAVKGSRNAVLLFIERREDRRFVALKFKPKE